MKCFEILIGLIVKDTEGITYTIKECRKDEQEGALIKLQTEKGYYETLSLLEFMKKFKNSLSNNIDFQYYFFEEFYDNITLLIKDIFYEKNKNEN